MKLRLINLLWALILTGCFTPEIQYAPNPKLKNLGIVPAPPKKKLLVFMDGTANEWKTRTNVRRLFEQIGAEQNPTNLCFYINGVGNLDGGYVSGILGSGFGWLMKPRIRAAYEFLCENWRDGDEIYIFGFSRGAHQARTLAGIISHCGLVDPAQSKVKSLGQISGKVWNFCLKKDDLANPSDWTGSQANQVPPFSSEMKTQLGLCTRYAEITFLGIWDTVPGSFFKKFDNYAECEDWRTGIRYKLRPYPPIREIAHAVALDERRSRFRPVLVGPSLDTGNTNVHECWFAGVHADLGGGYKDDSDLAGVSLNWMMGFLNAHGVFSGYKGHVYENPLGVGHESLYDFPNNFASKDERRWRPDSAQIHNSAKTRDGKEVYVRIRGSYTNIIYKLEKSGAANPDCR